MREVGQDGCGPAIGCQRFRRSDVSDPAIGCHQPARLAARARAGTAATFNVDGDVDEAAVAAMVKDLEPAAAEALQF